MLVKLKLFKFALGFIIFEIVNWQSNNERPKMSLSILKIVTNKLAILSSWLNLVATVSSSTGLLYLAFDYDGILRRIHCLSL